jgi:hypothetical protein
MDKRGHCKILIANRILNVLSLCQLANYRNSVTDWITNCEKCEDLERRYECGYNAEYADL